MPVVGAAVMPAAPVLLPEVSPDQPDGDREAVATVRDEIADTFRRLPTGAEVVVLLAPGPRGVHGAAVSSLRILGVNVDDVQLPVDSMLVPHVTRLMQYPLSLGGTLPVEHAVLTRLVADHLGHVPVLPISVDPATDGAVLVSVGAALVEALRDAGRDAIIIATGDLSACLTDASPGYVVDGAQSTDQAIVEALAQQDPDTLAGLGPDEAARVQASAWAPLTALNGAVAAGRLVVDGHPIYDVMRGVGRVHVRYATPEASREGERLTFPEQPDLA